VSLPQRVYDRGPAGLHLCARGSPINLGAVHRRRDVRRVRRPLARDSPPLLGRGAPRRG